MSEPTPPAEGASDRMRDAAETTESAWGELSSNLTLRDGFWLGYVFTADLRLVRELEARSEDLLRGKARGVRSFHAEQPGRLIDARPWLLDGCDDDVGLVWVTGLGGGHRASEWLEGWAPLLQRLNEHRDRLRRVLPAGLVLVGPPGLLDVARRAADLWDFRAMVIMAPVARPRPAAAPRVVEETTTIGSLLPALPTTVWSLLVARRSAESDRDFAELALRPPVEPSPGVLPFLQRAARALASGSADTALAAAHAAVNVRQTTEDEALARAHLARALDLNGDQTRAARNAQAALGARRPLGLELTRALLAILGQSPDLDEALAALRQDLSISRRQLDRHGEPPPAQRDLSVSLAHLGRVHEAKGDLGAALDAYTEALTLSEQLQERYGAAHVPTTAAADLRASVERVRRALSEA